VNDFFEHRGQLGELADLAVLQRTGSQCPAGATMMHASGRPLCYADSAKTGKE
jgi:hypothetical protein